MVKDETMSCGKCPYFRTKNISFLLGMTGSCDVLLMKADDLADRGVRGRIGAVILRFFARKMWTPLISDCAYYRGMTV